MRDTHLSCQTEQQGETGEVQMWKTLLAGLDESLKCPMEDECPRSPCPFIHNTTNTKAIGTRVFHSQRVRFHSAQSYLYDRQGTPNVTDCRRTIAHRSVTQPFANLGFCALACWVLVGSVAPDHGARADELDTPGTSADAGADESADVRGWIADFQNPLACQARRGDQGADRGGPACHARNLRRSRK